MTLNDQVEQDTDTPLRPLVQRQRILESARSIFLDKGHAGGSIDDIVALAGVSKSTVYSNFQNKDDLFESLIKSEARQIAQDLPGVDLKAPDPALSVQKLGAAIIRQFSQPATLAILRLVIGSMGRFPHLGEDFIRRSLGTSRFQVAAYFDMQKAGGSLEGEGSFAMADRFTNDCLAQSMAQLFIADHAPLSDSEIALLALRVFRRIETMAEQ